MDFHQICQRLTKAHVDLDANRFEIEKQHNYLNSRLSQAGTQEVIEVPSHITRLSDLILTLEIKRTEIEADLMEFRKQLADYSHLLTGKTFKHHQIIGGTDCWLHIEFPNDGEVHVIFSRNRRIEE